MKRTTLGWVLIGGIVLSIITHSIYLRGTAPVVYQAEAHEIEEIEKVILLEVETETQRLVRKIKATFPEEPRMVQVAFCESGWDDDGDGKKELHAHAVGPDGRDHGVFQIRDIHNAGDMFDEDENIAFARVLYDRNGLRDWSASAHCWMK